MEKRDELDKERARRIAWRFSRADEALALLAADEPSEAAQPAEGADGAKEPTPTPQDLETLRAEARAACDDLAEDVARAWALPPDAGQLEATERLARRASKLSMRLVAMRAPESIRLARLMVRHFRALSRSARRAAMHVWLWIDSGDPEVAELIVEIARSGNARAATGLLLSDEPEFAQLSLPGLAARLARVLEEARSWDVRMVTLDFLEVVCDVECVDALRRALRLPHLGVRSRAVHCLLEIGELTTEDVVTLLEEIVDHPLEYMGSSDVDDATMVLGADLQDALMQLRPEGGEDLLLAIAESDPLMHWSIGMDGAWAIATLAAAYPEHALPLIDERLRTANVRTRVEALDAIAKLPPEHARARLLVAAVDGASEISSRARDLWFEKMGGVCPFLEVGGDLAGLEKRLLRAPPSERFLQRLEMFRGPSSAGRAAMCAALLREAPDREALVLLLFALADDACWAREPKRKLPTDPKGWVARVVKGWGAAGVEGLCLLADRYPYRSFGGWAEAIIAACCDGVVKKRQAAPARAWAERRLLSEDWELVGDDFLRLFDATSLPLPLTDRILTLYLGGEGTFRIPAMLKDAPRYAPLDERLVREMREAMDAVDFDRLERAAAIALARKLPDAYALAEDALELLLEPEGKDALVISARALLEAGRLPRERVAEWLTDPEQHTFDVATHLVGEKPTREERALLIAALGSSAREGRAAAEAATALVLRKPRLRPGDPRLAQVLDAAPLECRAQLLKLLVLLRAPIATVARHLEEILLSDEESIYSAQWELIVSMHTRPYRAWLRGIYPRITEPGLRQEIREQALIDEGAFWQDGSRRVERGEN